MPFKVRRIVAAIADASAKKALARTAQLARRSGAAIELLSVVRPAPGVGAIVQDRQRLIDRAIIEAKRNEIEALAARLRRSGLRISCSVLMDSSVTDAILRCVQRSRADLLVIEARKHSAFARLLITQSDYDLIRHCPVPLLIVKKASAGSAGPVLAALDPWHVNDKPRSLDARIAEAGRAMAKTLGVALHGAHVYPPDVGLLANAAFAPTAIPVPASAGRKYAALVRRRFAASTKKYRIASGKTHLKMGDPSFVLPAIVRSLKSQLLVMGAVSRSALRRFLIGSTAERVLDAVACDLLIVKPRSSRERRPRRAHRHGVRS